MSKPSKIKLVRQPKARKRRAWEKSPLHSLPFVVRREDVGLPPPTGKQSPLCFWHVHPTGNYIEDCATGERLGVDYLNVIEQAGAPPVLQWLVADMPRELTGIEVGFLTIVGYAAESGAASGRRVQRYWEDCRRRENIKAIPRTDAVARR